MTSTAKNYAQKVHATLKALATPEQLAAHKKNQVRVSALRNFSNIHFGPRRLRVMANEEIHVYSRMPNSTTTGWWLAGSSAKEACERFFGPDSVLAECYEAIETDHVLCNAINKAT